MPDADLTLVLSGHLCRPQSADMRPFWCGFIELQRKLPTTRRVKYVVAHSWNQDLAGLVRLVYSPEAELHEPQASFYPEFLNRIEPPDVFERGLDRPNSTWKSVSIQSVLGNARSRARAVKLLEELPANTGQVLITRWDLGQTGSSQVNQLVADAALPIEYLYLSYFSEVDEGYADMWVLAPWSLAQKFCGFDVFILDCLAGSNEYLEKFCESGWPCSRLKTRYEIVRSHPIGQRIHTLSTKLLKAFRSHVKGSSFLKKVVRRAIDPIQQFLERPPLTAENSCAPNMHHAPRTFPKYMALNIHALLKYFILSQGMRGMTRFLTHEDFEIAAQSGQVINPQPFALVVWDPVEDALLSSRLRESSRLPIAAVFHAGKGVRMWSPDATGEFEMRVFQPTSSSSRDRLLCAVDAAIGQFGESIPILIMPSLEKYLSCSDWYYLNALLKFIVWRGVDYVGFEADLEGRPSLDFPCMQIVRGGGALSFMKAIGTARGMRVLLDLSDSELHDICERSDRMRLEFPVIDNKRGLF